MINIRMLEGTVTTVVKYGSKVGVPRKVDEDLLDVFQRNCLRIVMGTRVTERISNSRLYEKCESSLAFKDCKEREVQVARARSADEE